MGGRHRGGWNGSRVLESDMGHLRGDIAELAKTPPAADAGEHPELLTLAPIVARRIDEVIEQDELEVVAEVAEQREEVLCL